MPIYATFDITLLIHIGRKTKKSRKIDQILRKMRKSLKNRRFLMIFLQFYQKYIEAFFAFLKILPKTLFMKITKKMQFFVIFSTKHAYEMAQLFKKTNFSVQYTFV